MNAPRSEYPASPGRSAFDWAREAQLGPELARAIRAEVKRRRRRRLTVATTLLCLALGTGVYWFHRDGAGRAGMMAEIAASASVVGPEQRTLADGSIIELKPGAEIRAEFTPAERRVTLVQGEAHFQVAKNPQRPFVVAVRGVEVRAVGTGFSVSLEERSVEVIVTEGVVALDSDTARGVNPGAADPAVEKMIAGQHAVVELAASTAPAVQSLSTSQLAQRLAWRVPRLQFSGAPLREVIELFRRHGGIQFRLEDSSLGAVRVSGILRASNSDALLRLLAADHGIAAEQHDGEIVLRRGR